MANASVAESAQAIDAKAYDVGLGEYKDIDQIDPSPLNPRKAFSQERLQELAKSIKEVGVIEPLVVRPGKGTRVEIVAGERRYRAAKIAGLATLPVMIKYLTDAQVLVLAAIENEQRDDIHPLERAAGYRALMDADPSFTPETIAQRIGKSKRWVQLCLQYLTLIPAAQQAFRDGQITAGHADLIVRLNPAQQKDALAACFREDMQPVLGIYELGGKVTKERVLVSVRDLDEWIREHVRLPLDPKSPQLDLLPDVQAAIAETDPVYHANTPRLLELIDSHWIDPKVKQPPLTRDKWTFVKPGQTCDTQQRGVIVLGTHRGRILTVCTGVGVCKTHWPHTLRAERAETETKSAPKGKAAPVAPKKSAADLKREQEERRYRDERAVWETTVRPQALALAKAKLQTLKPGPVAYGIIASAMREHGLFNVPRGPKTLGALLIGLASREAANELDDFRNEIAKPLGIDLKPLFAAATPKPAPEKSAPKKAAAKSPAAARRRTLGKGKK